MITTRILRLSLAVLAAASVAGCSSNATGASTNTSTSPAPARRDRSSISTEELRSSQASNLYEVVQRLHPEWLQSRNASAINGSASTDIAVYLDTQRAGSSDYLKQLALNSAAALRYYSASEAQSRFGNGNMNGVIQVVTMVRR